MWFDKPEATKEESVMDYWMSGKEDDFLKEYYCPRCDVSFFMGQCPYCKKERS